MISDNDGFCDTAVVPAAPEAVAASFSAPETLTLLMAFFRSCARDTTDEEAPDEVMEVIIGNGSEHITKVSAPDDFSVLGTAGTTTTFPATQEIVSWGLAVEAASLAAEGNNEPGGADRVLVQFSAKRLFDLE